MLENVGSKYIMYYINKIALTRIQSHQTDVTDETDGKILESVVGAPYNVPGHKFSDMSIFILEKVYIRDLMTMLLEERVDYTLASTEI